MTGKRIKLLLAAMVCGLLALAAADAAFVNHFDNDADQKGMPGKYLRLSSEKSFSGGKCLTGGGTIPIPGKDEAGTLTFWVYSPTQEPELHGQNGAVYFSVLCEGERKEIPIEMGFKSGHDQWVFFHGGNNDIWDASGVALHPGWTRFDIVNPGGAEPRPFAIRVDGREVAKTPERLTRIKSLRFDGGGGKMFVDEVSYGLAFRPNVVQAVRAAAADKDGYLDLQAGEPLKVTLALYPAGAPTGKLAVRLLDGLEKTLLEKTVEVDWRAQGDKPLTVELPSPPRSGYFWLQAQVGQDVCRSRLDVQFHNYLPVSTGVLRLTEGWDFIPTVIKLGDVANPPDSLEIPAAPPTDWSGAKHVAGPWFSHGNRTLKRCNAGWYHRLLEVPKAFQGKRLWLDIDTPGNAAYVFVGGENTGLMAEYPGATLDLGKWLHAGETASLDLYVVDSPYFGTSRMGAHRVLKKLLGKDFRQSWFKGWGAESGLAGPVTLLAVPEAARIAAVALRPSVKDKKLTAVFELDGLTPGQYYRLDTVAGAAGKPVLELPPAKFAATATSQSVAVSSSWENPVLWEMDAPYLYDFDAKLLDADGDVLDVMRPERFGFREITLDRRIKLNGVPLTLFTSIRDCDRKTMEFGQAEAMRRGGLNFIQKFADYAYSGGADWRAFDEAGIALRPTAACLSVGAGSLLSKYNLQDNPEYWEAFGAAAKYALRKFRNHPCVFFQTGAKELNPGMNYNPKLMDGVWRKSPGDNPTWRAEAKVYERCRELLHSLAPDIPLDFMDALNDTISISSYINFAPIQEAIEENEPWLAYGSKPFMVEEQASPFQWDWANAAGHDISGAVPHIAESCAITKGDAAFVRDAVDDEALAAFEKAALADLAKAAPKALEKARVTFGGFNAALAVYSKAAANKRDEVWAERLQEQILNWRADGIGAYCGNFNALGVKLEPLLAWLQAPVTAFLAGTPSKRSAKDHIFAPGETLVRGALILNNQRRPVEVECAWRLLLDGKEVAGESKRLAVPAGGQMSLPIRAEIPAGGDRQGSLEMSLRAASGELLAQDRCDIDILAPRPRGNAATIALIDPVGDSAKTLKALGVDFRLLNFNADLKDYRTVVFGRDAFKHEEASLPGGIDLGALGRAGKNVLILEQSQEVLKNRFKFRPLYMSPRDIFPRVAGHPLFDGLSDRTLRYWRGAATLTDGYEESLKELDPRMGWGHGAWRAVQGDDGTEHHHNMKWGNTHNLATVVILKPETGGFRTLADCEYGLNYAAVLELLNTDGRIVFSQVDATARTEPDPAAARYLQNLLRFVETAPAPVWCQAVYRGGPEGEKLLKSLRAEFTRNEPAPGDVLVLGEATPEQLAAWKPALDAFVTAGGTLFSLPKDEKQLAALGFATKRQTINHSVVGRPVWPLLAGLGNGDFHWNGDVEAVTLDSGLVEEVPLGKGRQVLCQVGPGLFDLDQRPWLKDSQRRSERILATLLTNLGVATAPPKLLSSPDGGLQLAATFDLSGVWEAAVGEEQPTTGWRFVTLPGSFQTQLPDLARGKGSVWFRRSFELKKTLPAGAVARLRVGQVSGSDWIYLNGKKVAETTSSSDPNEVGVSFRDYVLPAGAVKQGKNGVFFKVQFDRDALLGMANTTGAVVKPLRLEVHAPAASSQEALDLSGVWKGYACKTAEPCPPLSDKRWANVKVPGHYDSPDAKGYPADWKNHNGYFWCRRTFKLEEVLPPSAEPFLLLGGVDDEDTTYINGKQIGHLGSDNFTGTGWTGSVLRKYPVPRELLKQGVNEVAVLIYDPVNDGGVWQAPVALVFADPDETKDAALLASPYLHKAELKDDPYRASSY